MAEKWLQDFELIQSNICIGNADDREEIDFRQIISCECNHRRTNHNNNNDDGLYNHTNKTCLDMHCSNYHQQIECIEQNCQCFEKCGNRRFDTNTRHPEVQVIEAVKKGFGVVTKSVIKKGDFIMELLGEIITEEEFVKRRKVSGQNSHEYIVQLKKKTYLDCSSKGAITRYINHSCEPNSTIQIWNVKGKLRVGVFAIINMNIGDELSFDYRWETAKHRKPTKCHCGTKSCRGYIEIDVEESDFICKELRTGVWKPRTELLKISGINDIYLAGKWLVDKQIKVWWEGNQSFFEADVLSFNSTTFIHEIQYLIESDISHEFLLSDYKSQLVGVVDASLQDLKIYNQDTNWFWLDETEEELRIKKKSTTTLKYDQIDDTSLSYHSSLSAEEIREDQRSLASSSVSCYKNTSRFTDHIREDTRYVSDNYRPSLRPIDSTTSYIKEIVLVTNQILRFMLKIKSEKTNGGDDSAVISLAKSFLQNQFGLIFDIHSTHNKTNQIELTAKGHERGVQKLLSFLKSIEQDVAALQSQQYNKYMDKLLALQSSTITCDWRYWNSSVKYPSLYQPGLPCFSTLVEGFHSCFPQHRISISNREVAILSKYIRCAILDIFPDVDGIKNDKLRSSSHIHVLIILSRLLSTVNESLLPDSIVICVSCIVLVLKAKGLFSSKYLLKLVKSVYTIVSSKTVDDDDPALTEHITRCVEKEEFILQQLRFDIFVPDILPLFSVTSFTSFSSESFAQNAIEECLLFTELFFSYHGAQSLLCSPDCALLSSFLLAISLKFVYFADPWSPTYDETPYLAFIGVLAEVASKFYSISFPLLKWTVLEFLRSLPLLQVNEWLHTERVQGRKMFTITSLDDLTVKVEGLFDKFQRTSSTEPIPDQSINRVYLPWFDAYLARQSNPPVNDANNMSSCEQGDTGPQFDDLCPPSGDSVVDGFSSAGKYAETGLWTPLVSKSLDPCFASFPSSKSSVHIGVAVSRKQWPSCKVRAYELKKDVSIGLAGAGGSGFSAAALFELQVLQQLSYIVTKKGTSDSSAHIECAVGDLFAQPLCVLRATDTARKSSRNGADQRVPSYFLLTNALLMDLPSLVSSVHKDPSKASKSAYYLREYCRDLLRVLSHCFDCGVLFKWISPDDIYLTSNGNLCLSGFQGATMGVSKTLISKKKKNQPPPHISTLESASPEVMLGSEATIPSSLWTISELCLYILTGKHILKTCPQDMHKQVQYIYRIFGTPKKMGCDMQKFNKLPMANIYGSLLKTDNDECIDARARAEKVIQQMFSSQMLSCFEKHNNEMATTSHTSSEDSIVCGEVVDYFGHSLRLVPENRMSIVEQFSHAFMSKDIHYENILEKRKAFAQNLRVHLDPNKDRNKHSKDKSLDDSGGKQNRKQSREDEIGEEAPKQPRTL